MFSFFSEKLKIISFLVDLKWIFCSSLWNKKRKKKGKKCYGDDFYVLDRPRSTLLVQQYCFSEIYRDPYSSALVDRFVVSSFAIRQKNFRTLPNTIMIIVVSDVVSQMHIHQKAQLNRCFFPVQYLCRETGVVHVCERLANIWSCECVRVHV